MAMVVKNNMGAVSTLNTLNKNSAALQKSLSRVSSGMKINSAQDDASGYAISERMRVQIRSLDQANQNTQNGSSLMKTAEGAVANTVEILKTLKEKAINAATDTNTDSDRVTIQKEINQFIDQIDDNALTTFNGKYLVDGSKSQQGDAVATSMTNQSLAKNTTGDTKLVDLENRNEESLEIKDTDFVTASYVKNGETVTTKFKVSNNTLNDIFNALDSAGGGGIFKDAAANITDPTGANVGKVAMSYQDATSYINDNGNDAAYSAIINGDSNSDSKLAEALATVYTTNAAGDDLSGVTDVTDDISADLIAKKDAVATLLDGAKGTAFNGTGGGVQVNTNTSFAAWKDKDGNVQSSSQATWDAGGTTAASNDGYQAYITDAVNAAAAWTPGAVNSVDTGSAAGAAAEVLTSLGISTSATTAPANVSGWAGTNLNYQVTAVQELATAALKEAAASKASGIDKTEPYHAKYVNTDDGSTIDTSAANYTQETQYTAKESHTLSKEKLQALGVTVAGDEATADEIKTALTTAITAANTAANNNTAANQLSISDYIGSRATALAASGTYYANTASGDNQKAAFEALDKADALYNAWQAAKDTTENPNATATTAGPVDDSDVVGQNSFGDDVKTANGEIGLTIKAASTDIKNQISGVTISITDSEGNVKKAANAALDDFRTTIYAKNKSDRNELTFQVGAAANQAITVGLEDMRSEALGLKGSDGSKVSVATQDKANAAVAVFDNAIQKALDQQTTIGAVEARLEYTSTNLTTMSENVQGAESTIRDADMAKEMTNYTKNNVLLQAAQSMLAQANQSSSAVLSLLQ